MSTMPGELPYLLMSQTLGSDHSCPSGNLTDQKTGDPLQFKTISEIPFVIFLGIVTFVLCYSFTRETVEQWKREVGEISSNARFPIFLLSPQD